MSKETMVRPLCFLACLCLCFLSQGASAFRPPAPCSRLARSAPASRLPTAATAKNTDGSSSIIRRSRDDDEGVAGAVALLSAAAVLLPPSPAHAAAGPVPSALLAWLHFLGLAGVAGGLATERLLLKKDMSVEEENTVNVAVGIYGLSALSLLVTGYFRVTQFAKGWEYYQHEPIFWLKMSSVAVLGGLSFFPAIVWFRRDLARKEGKTLPPLSDALVDRCSTIINAELLAFATIPLLASLMARGVLYWNEFPWPLGVALYVVSLGGAGFKYGKEAFDMMESEGALQPINPEEESIPMLE